MKFPSINLESGALIVAAVTFLLFYPATSNTFVALDDYAYIVSNPHLTTFGWDTIIWAMTSYHEGNWHPLTMLSLAVDRSVWGLKPFGFHLTNVILHCCTVFGSCILFSNLLSAAQSHRNNLCVETISARSRTSFLPALSNTSIIIGSLAGALFFGCHPLRVESVVWASERKDVLCLFFVTASLVMYIRFTRGRFREPRMPFWRFRTYFYTLLLAMLALMSKPTAVSLPFVLLLIDWYPLHRITGKGSFISSLIEKIPFIILSTIGIFTTIAAQQIAMKYAPSVDLPSRILVACKALLFYLAKTVWPTGLTVFYMHPGNIASTDLFEYLAYALLVICLSIVVVLAGKLSRLWPALWLFYVITLLPMLGLVQVGGQWVADRYSYLPSLGISLVWGGGVAVLSAMFIPAKRNVPVYLFSAIAVCQLMVYIQITKFQIKTWQNTETLASRIIEITPHGSGAPYMARAIYRNEAGRYKEALEDIHEAMKIALRRGLTRTYADIAFEQGVILKNLGRYSEALNIVEWGIATSVSSPPPDAISLRDELDRLKAGGADPNR